MMGLSTSQLYDRRYKVCFWLSSWGDNVHSSPAIPLIALTLFISFLLNFVSSFILSLRLSFHSLFCPVLIFFLEYIKHFVSCCRESLSGGRGCFRVALPSCRQSSFQEQQPHQPHTPHPQREDHSIARV